MIPTFFKWKYMWIILLVSLSNAASAQIISEELFDEPNGSTTGVMSDGSIWAAGSPGQCDGNAGVWGVQTGSFTITDIEGFDCCNCGSGGSNPPLNCGNNQSEILFNDIDISNVCGNIAIDIIWQGSSGMECDFPAAPEPSCNGGHDQLVAEYSIDGSAFTVFGYLCGNTVIITPSTGFVLSGNSLDIKISGGNQAASETYTIQSVIVSTDGGTMVTGSLTGGGNLCGTNCTTINWNISGGTPLYDIGFTITFGGIPFPFNFPGAPSMGSINVCLDPGTPIASYDAASNTIFANPSFANLISVSLDDVTDSDGCMTDVSESISINIVDPPAINDIADLEVCTNEMGIATIELTQYEAAIGSGNNVNWYSDEALSISIGPSFMTGVNTTIFATVDDGNGCESSAIEIDITLFLPPILETVENVFACDEYVLPPIEGLNLNNPAYYSGPGQTGSIFLENQVIDFNTTIYVYDENSACNDEIFFEITIFPSPEIDPINSVLECGYFVLPEITGNNVSPFAQYWTLPGGLGNAYNAGDTIDFSTILYAYDLLGTCSDEVTITIIISPSPELDTPDVMEACGQVILPPISGNNLSGSQAYFTEMNGGGNSFSVGDTITSSQTLYIYDAIGNCTSEVSLEINLSQGPVLDVLPDVTVCDFYILPEITSESNGEPVNCYYTIEGQQLVEGDTVFTSQTSAEYLCEVENNLTCFAQLEFAIEIQENIFAGNGDTLTACTGSLIDLLNLLSNDAEPGGTFLDLEGSGAINNDSIDLNQVMGQTQVSFAYAVANICGSDTAYFTIQIEDFVDAGQDNSNSVCDGTIVDLNNLVNGTPGGMFFDVDTGLSIGDELTTSGEAGNTLEVIYIVGDGFTCEQDTAILSVEVTASPSFASQPIVTTCSDFALPLITGNGIDTTASYYTEPDGQGIEIEPGSLITETSLVYLYYSNGFCSASDSLQINVGSISNTMINETICENESIDINGTIYDINSPSGTQMLSGLYGCDSTLTIVVNFYETDTLLIDTELCFGQTIVVNGNTYDENFPSGFEMLDNAAANGCDSIIEVALQFSNASITPINEMLCSNDSILINGTFYSINNPGGLDTLQGNSGCDSILDIQLSFLFASTSQIDTTICPSSSIIVNGTTYDVNNSSGTESIPGVNQFGCDSIVDVNVSFFNIPQGLFMETVCPGETITIFGVEFSEANPEQIVVLEGASAQNCDSTVLVNIDFYDIQEGLVLETICVGSTITIQGTEYSEANPSGQFTVQNSEGCDSIVNVIVAFEATTSELEIINPECSEGEDGYVVFNGLSSASAEYMYSLDGEVMVPISIGDTIFSIAPGDHTLNITTDEGCISNNTFTIADPEVVSVQLNELVVIQEGASVQVNLDVPSDAVIEWSPDIEISCTDCSNPVFSPSDDITYFLTVTTAAGCVEMDTIAFRVEQQTEVYIPNVFSPNQDGINDVFSIFSDEDIEYEMHIYDRWGNLMFSGEQLQSNNTNDGWDGTHRGQTCKPGVYVFHGVLSIPSSNPNQADETRLIQGDITLIR